MEPYITHIQSNTDGLLVIPHDLVKVREIVKEWENRTGMVMDEEWGCETGRKMLTTTSLNTGWFIDH